MDYDSLAKQLAELERVFEEDNINAMKEAEYQYWGALLSFNGIIIGLFSIISIVTNQYQWHIFVLVAVALFVSAIILRNYKIRKNWIEKLSSSKDLNKLYDLANLSYKRIHRNEGIVLWLLIVEAATILFLVFPAK